MLSAAVEQLVFEIRSKKITNSVQLNKRRLAISREYSLSSLPSNANLISFASVRDKKKFQRFLSVKPTRSMSGVTVVAVMTKPFGCVGKCIFCPSSLVEGKETPKSYTGKEPSTMRSMMFNFNPFLVVQNRLSQYMQTNNLSPKIELILQGGTFTWLSFSHQKYFVKRCYDGVLGFGSKSLSSAKLLLEKSPLRVVGLTIETRPDWCGKKEINRLLSLGATRVELGVQLPDDEVYKKNSRGHTVKEVVESTRLLKDSCFKVAYHLMPGLYGSSPQNDLEKLKQVFSDKNFCPDMVKIYPCLVMKGTPLYNLWLCGKFSPMDSVEAAELIAELKRFVPKYVRIMRIQRDIPSNLIDGGVKKSNLRQLVQQKLSEKNLKCNCIRCREVGLNSLYRDFDYSTPKLCRLDYNASNGKEVFLSFEDKKNDLLHGFCRLRMPFEPFRKEITSRTGLIRELHVYSRALGFGEKPFEDDFQHQGLGTSLMLEAEKIAQQEFDANKMLVISGVGVKEYYRKKLDYKDDGPYVSKKLF